MGRYYCWALLSALLSLSSLLLIPAPVLAQRVTPPPVTGPVRKPAGRAARKVLAVTVISVNGATATLKPDEGNAPLTAFLTADTKYHRAGDKANQRGLIAGEKVVTRLAFYPDGTNLAAEVWDPRLYEELSRLRKEVVTGTVETPLPPGSVAGVLVVRPGEDSPLVSYRVTEKTYFYRNNSPVAPAAYPQGAEVAVKPRALPSGGFMANIVAESPAALDIAYKDTLSRWEGTMENWDAPNFSFLLKRGDGVIRRVIFPKDLTITDESAKGRASDRRIYGPAEVVGRTVIVRLARGERPREEGMRTAVQITVVSGSAPKTSADGLATTTPSTASDLQDYPLYYLITTGNPYEVKLPGKSKRVQIAFDRDQSDKSALLALQALTWNILYPNAKGKIILQGKLIHGSGTFILRHWYITPPLMKRVTKTPVDVDEYREFTVTSLTRDDFRKTDTFDPTDKTFDPAFYTIPLRKSSRNERQKETSVVLRQNGKTTLPGL